MNDHIAVIRKRLDKIDAEGSEARLASIRLTDAGRTLVWVLHMLNEGKTIPERDMPKVKAAMRAFGRGS